ncbi:anthranilate synthase component I family protein [Persephonella sp.]
MKVYLFSDGEGWFKEKGLYVFNDPVYRVIYKNGVIKINGKSENFKDPLDKIEEILKKEKLFCVGFISYDFGKKLITDNLKRQEDDLYLPEIYCLFFKGFDTLEVIKNENKNVVKKINFTTSESEYIEKVLKAKKFISQGDIYQVNLSHRVDIEGEFSPEDTFFNLVTLQPSPYLMLIKDEEFSVLSASMELFLEKNGDTLTTKPIKGTRKRGKNQDEDRILYEELKNSKKEMAENLMITDLMRNDLSRISEIGSVKVESLFSIEKYRFVYQMVSTIKSKIKRGTTLSEIIKNTFPPGSVTGAPKKRAVEIISYLEKYVRSVYCGTLFLIKPDGDFVMSVAIRQSIFKDNLCYIYVGSGIVSDSDPKKEYEETLIKLQANLKSLKSE